MSSEIYGPASPERPPVVSVIDAPVGRKLNNALTLKLLQDGAEEPFATAVQSGADGAGKKLGILFGFKNGSAGAHVATYADGTTLTVPTVDHGPTTVTRGDGTAVATITRGATTTVTAPDGSTILAFLPDPAEPKADSHYRLAVVDGSGAPVATMDVIRQGASYSSLELVDTIGVVTGAFAPQAGGALPLPFLGVRTMLYRQLTPLERDVVVAATVELGISIRPYITEMGEYAAAWT